MVLMLFALPTSDRVSTRTPLHGLYDFSMYLFNDGHFRRQVICALEGAGILKGCRGFLRVVKTSSSLATLIRFSWLKFSRGPVRPHLVLLLRILCDYDFSGSELEWLARKQEMRTVAVCDLGSAYHFWRAEMALHLDSSIGNGLMGCLFMCRRRKHWMGCR